MSGGLEHEGVGPVQPLTAIDAVHPGAGECLEVIAGQVLVFAVAPDGRRLPLGSVPAGGVVVGAGTAAGGERLLATGMPGTEVRRGAVAGLGGDAPLAAWAGRLASAAAAGRWPPRLLPLDQAGSMVAPGEHIVGPARGGLVWVRLSGGSAMLCGDRGASLGPSDPAVPLPPGVWLTAGLRVRAHEDPPPSGAAGWSDGLDLLARLVMACATEARRREDDAIVGRLAARTRAADAAAAEAVDVLAASVGGTEHLPLLPDPASSAEFAAAVEVARAAGLTVTDDGLARAAEEVESGRDPVTALAGACGGRTRPVTLAPDWWRRDGAPVVVRVAEDGARTERVAAAVRRRTWVLVDPLTGTSRAVDAETAARVDRRATELLPVLPAAPATLVDLGRLALRGSGRELAVVGLVTAGLAALSFVTPFLMGQLATVFVSSSPDAAYVGLFGAMMLAVVAGATWQAVRSLSLLRGRSRAAAVSGAAVWERIMRQRTAWHAAHTLGDRTAQASAVNNASASLPDESITRMLDVAMVLGSLAAVATTNVSLLAALAALTALQLVVTLALLRTVSRRASDRVGAAAAATGRLMETLRAVNRLRVAGAESRAFLRWAQVQATFSRADLALRRTAMVQGIVIAVWPVLMLVAVVAVTAVTGASFGDFVTAQTAAAAAAMAVASMSLAASSSLVARQALRQAQPALEAVPEGGSGGAAPGRLSGALQARDLVFRYGPDLPAVLDRVSLDIRPGEHVAVVGPSGCGKTTLLRVLLGLDDPESGVIAVDGRDLAGLDRPAVRRQVGSVLQSSTLLPGSLRDNITMGRPMGADQVWAALDAAALGDDVRAMAMGIDTPVTDGGGTLSGGQRQRVLIARALAGAPRMLVLDEATSALDNLTQTAVVEALEGLRITRLVVAHRLSTIRRADRVIVMAEGRVVDEGTYAELVARPGVFRDLAERQHA